MCASAVAFAALAAVTAQVKNGRLVRLDQAAIRVVRQGRRPAGVTMARGASALAEPAFCAPLLTACVVVAAGRAGWRRAYAPCLAVAGGVMPVAARDR
jgi:hypothetical protein